MAWRLFFARAKAERGRAFRPVPYRMDRIEELLKFCVQLAKWHL